MPSLILRFDTGNFNQSPLPRFSHYLYKMVIFYRKNTSAFDWYLKQVCRINIKARNHVTKIQFKKFLGSHDATYWFQVSIKSSGSLLSEPVNIFYIHKEPRKRLPIKHTLIRYLQSTKIHDAVGHVTANMRSAQFGGMSDIQFVTQR